MKMHLLIGLAALAALVTGCPRNNYTLELTPRGSVMERKLTFYRSDGTETNGAPKYQDFPSNELAAITAAYPAGALKREGQRHFASGEFSGAMPADIGGAGVYTNITTSLGQAGFYVERFRGNDDLSVQQAKRLAAASQLADLVVGWSRIEFKNQRGYRNLRRCLDGDFRHDLTNAALYSWVAVISSGYKSLAGEEFAARFGLYLVERGYVSISYTPLLAQLLGGNGDGNSVFALLVQHLVAGKMGLPLSGPASKPIAFLADPAAVKESWDRYLSTTPTYHSRLRNWEYARKANPKLDKPDPSDVANDLLVAAATPGSSGQDDLTVRLSLPTAPDHTNGKWEEMQKQVLWDTELEAKDPAARLPVICYASWSQPDSQFQQEHFGRTLLSGDELMSYCLWQSALDSAQSRQWENFLSALQPGIDLTNKLAAFSFAPSPQTNGSAADFAKNLLKDAVAKAP